MANNKVKKQLFEKINKLSSTEHEEIYKIIKDRGVEFTQNKNGIFFNISNLDDDTINDIECFVTYSLNNSKELDEYEKKMKECKLHQTVNNIISGLDYQSFELNSFNIKDTSEWEFLESIEEKKITNIANFVEKMNTDHDKICKKKMNVKFYNAQKKYTKKNISDKKNNDFCDGLLKESYL